MKSMAYKQTKEYECLSIDDSNSLVRKIDGGDRKTNKMRHLFGVSLLVEIMTMTSGVVEQCHHHTPKPTATNMT